jgi:hypothetical protein
LADLPREPGINNRKLHSSSEPFKDVKGFYNREICALFQLLLDASLRDNYKHSLRKYLIIVVFAALDYYFRNAARNLIDNNDMKIESLFGVKSHPKLYKLIKGNATTKGNIVASTYRFVDIHEIDFVFSNFLQMISFLDVVIKLNDIDQTRYVLDGHPIPIEYEKLERAYKLRNDIAHEIKPVRTSNSMVITLWDNLMNVMDICNAVFLSASDLTLRHSLKSKYLAGKDRARRKAEYKLNSDEILSKLIGNEQTNLKSRTDEIFVHWVISKMLKEQLIWKNGDVAKLTSKGKNRFKRTKKRDREKWKRELSSITCSWITERKSYELE